MTGITTTGTPHLGNYVGAVRPAIRASRAPGVESFFFLADYHALIKCDEPARIARSTLEIAATWLASGLDPGRVVFYRQSDIVEIPELTWLLTCVASKGAMNRAHAYKAAVDQNVAAREEPDAGVTMGLYSYPILMAADILMFNAHAVPVGRDQVQHIEMARDLAQRFNHLFGAGRELFVLPEAEVDERVAVLPGLDGRKMSKSYGNTVPLFEGGAAGLRDAIARVVTDSRLPGEPKEPEGAQLVALFDAFADDAERAALRAELRGGLGWGDAKARVVARIEAEVGPMRARYAELIAQPEQVEAALQAGAAKARQLAGPFLAQLRAAVGLRPMVATVARTAGGSTVDADDAATATATAGRAATARALAESDPLAPGATGGSRPKPALPTFKQYREPDGRFYFKLVGADGRLLLQSAAFDTGRDAGRWVARLREEGASALALAPASLADGVDPAAARAALAALADARAAAAASPLAAATTLPPSP